MKALLSHVFVQRNNGNFLTRQVFIFIFLEFVFHQICLKIAKKIEVGWRCKMVIDCSVFSADLL